MRILAVVNALDELKPSQTTTALLHSAREKGHDVLVVDVVNLGVGVDGRVVAHAVRWSDRRQLRTRVDDVDQVWIRTNPARDPLHAWAHEAMLELLETESRAGVDVVNDPVGVRRLGTKLALFALPDTVRPRGIVSRHTDELLAFLDSEGGKCVMKPVRGTHGRDVFLVHANDPNTRTVIDLLTRNGLAIAQEVLPEAANGDVRLILVDGQPLRVGTRMAAVRRRPPQGGFRSNVAAGGTPEAVVTDPRLENIASIVGPILVEHGIRLAGLDVIGDKLVEINVYATGGLPDAGAFEDVDFVGAVVDALTSTEESA